MQSITDVIEEFILSTMAQDDMVELSRNDLAKYFSCVPSQINYVLNTRFTLNKGYLIESARGGAGFVKVIRINQDKKEFLNYVLSLCNCPLNYTDCCQIIENLYSKKFITDREQMLIKRAISPKSVNNPLNMDNIIRTNILKEIIMELMKIEK